MARLSSVPKTPQAQVAQSDKVEEDEDVNEGANEQDPGLDIDAASNGKITNLGSNLPDVSVDWENLRSSPMQSNVAPTANMGNEQSHETNTAIRETSSRLLRDRQPSGSSGKLPKLSRQSSRAGDHRPASNQKTLPQQLRARPGVYELESSPEKTFPVKRHTAGKQSQFSPLKAQRSRKAQASKDTIVPNEPNSSPRRSRRQQGLSEETAGGENDVVHADAQLATRQKEGAALTDEELYRDFFRGQGHSEDGAVAVPAPLEENRNETIAVASTNNTADAEAGAPEEERDTRRATRGRPKKAFSQLPPEQGRKRGRPSTKLAKKTAEVVAGKTKPAPSLAVKELRKRARKVDADEEYHEEHAEEDEFDSEEEEEEADNGAKEPSRSQPQRDRVRPSQLFADVREGHDIISSDPPDTGEVPPLALRKRKQASQQYSEANTGRKRRRVTEGETQVEEQDELHEHRLFGQWPRLRQIVRNLDHVGRNVAGGRRKAQNVIDLEDKHVKTIVDLCDEARERFRALQGATEPDTESDPAGVLIDIAERVDGLRGKNDEYPTDFQDQRKSTDIYAHLIPKLVKLLSDAVTCYVNMENDTDQENHSAGQITMGHLRIVQNLVWMILKLEQSAQRYRRPDTNLHIVQPVHNGIAVPLRDIYKAFKHEIRQHEHGVQKRRRAQDEARHDAERLAREEQEGRQAARIRDLQDKWGKLHDERIWAEGGFPKASKREHLQIASNMPIEFDRNGRPFSRAQAFTPRVGPTPDMVDRAASKEWEWEELVALHDGLKHYTGPNVFEKIFRRYCGVRRELNKFNVTEIVTKAAQIKEQLISVHKHEEWEGAVEDWISAIPVWTKAQIALGKENEASFVDLTAES